MDVRVRELRLPGIGHRYELSLDNDRRLIIVVQGNGRREISILSGVRDEPDVAASLTQDQAVAVAAILTGARYSIDTSEDERTSTSEVGVETVTLNERSPAVGRLARDVPLLRDSEAAILAVIRDETPELVEDDTTQPCQAGDRIVVAARRDRLDDVIRQLAG